MADTKISALTADATPSVDDLIVTVDDPAGTPANKKVTLDNALALYDSKTSTLTNKTFDADGTGNSITNIENADIKAAAAIALNKLAATTASRALVSDVSGFVSASAVTSTELGYVSGVTSAIQTQINGKAASSHTHAASDVTSGTLVHERGGLEADVSAYNGLVKISGGATSSVAAPTGTIVGTSDSQTLSAKTLTAPKILTGGFIADDNGNEQIKFTTTASAVNEVTVTNAATTNNPSIAATGGDTNISLKLLGKGTGMPFGNMETWIIPISDETTAITTGTAKVTFRSPYAFTVAKVKASLTTASSSGNPTFDINEGGASILSTKLSIDSSELTSKTAATAAVISDSALADDAEITIDIDTAGTGAKGAKIYIIGYATALPA